MSDKCYDPVYLSSGEVLVPKSSLEYLGGLLSDAGHIGSELSRRIGCAKNEFRVLRKVWNDAVVSLKRRPYLYKALVETKLLYALASTCLTEAQQRQVDGFQAKCLRQILRIINGGLVNESRHRRAR